MIGSLGGIAELAKEALGQPRSVAATSTRAGT
jgi:hypothetical protein